MLFALDDSPPTPRSKKPAAPRKKDKKAALPVQDAQAQLGFECDDGLTEELERILEELEGRDEPTMQPGFEAESSELSDEAEARKGIDVLEDTEFAKQFISVLEKHTDEDDTMRTDTQDLHDASIAKSLHDVVVEHGLAGAPADQGPAAPAPAVNKGMHAKWLEEVQVSIAALSDRSHATLYTPVGDKGEVSLVHEERNGGHCVEFVNWANAAARWGQKVRDENGSLIFSM
eukprot:8013459-Pyramimonas_sp.AAC.1